MVFTSQKAAKVSNEKLLKIVCCYRHFDQSLFREDLNKLDWNIVHSCNSVDDAVSCFYDMFMSIVNKHLPLLMMQ